MIDHFLIVMVEELIYRVVIWEQKIYFKAWFKNYLWSQHYNSRAVWFDSYERGRGFDSLLMHDWDIMDMCHGLSMLSK